jgi:hypothetical protein
MRRERHEEDGGMHHIRYLPLRGLGLLATLLAALVLAGPLPASQTGGEGVRIEGYADPGRQPLTAAEIQQATTALESDTRARKSLAGSQRVRTIVVERAEEDKDARTGQRHAQLVLYNYDTNETIAAVVTLGPSPGIKHLTVTRGQPLGVGTEEAEEATRLALAHPTVQARLQAAGLAGRESELIITHLLAQPPAPDACATHRCVMLFFNTPDAVLDIEPVVDLTTGEVEVQ